jgi:hypothetical protein
MTPLLDAPPVTTEHGRLFTPEVDPNSAPIPDTVDRLAGDGRLVLRLDPTDSAAFNGLPGLTYGANEQVTITDQVSGLRFTARRAACGAGCACAAVVTIIVDDADDDAEDLDRCANGCACTPQEKAAAAQADATHARYFYDNGEAGGPTRPDTRTATCDQHKVAAPDDPEFAGSKPLPLPDEANVPCVVCQLPYADLIGRPVITWRDGPDRGYVYAGPGRHEGMEETAFGFGTGGPTTVKCDPTRVAPIDTAIPVKDERVQITKYERGNYPTWVGPWHLTIPSGPDAVATSFHKTKRDATTEGLRRLAITDYHATRANA